MMMPDCRLLTLADVDSAAKVISRAFVDDPLCSFVLPFRWTRVKTLYKFFIGVLPSERGKGVSSSLIRPFLEMADSQKLIAYTDTVTRSNVSLYEHFGFQCMEGATIPGTGITVWALRRPAI